MGIVIGWGNLNGVVSSNIYRTKPRFYSGHGTVLAYLTLFLGVGSLLTRFGLQAENKKRLSGKRDYLTQGMSKEEIDGLADGDKRYVVVLSIFSCPWLLRGHDADHVFVSQTRLYLYVVDDM